MRTAKTESSAAVDGHPRARGDLQDDQAEAGGDGVGEPRERRVLAVAAQQLGVLLVAGGLQLGLQAEGDEPGGVGGVGRGDGRAGRRSRRRAPARSTRRALRGGRSRLVLLGQVCCEARVQVGGSARRGGPVRCDRHVRGLRPVGRHAGGVQQGRADDEVGAAELGVVELGAVVHGEQQPLLALPVGRADRRAGGVDGQQGDQIGQFGVAAAGLGEQAGEPARRVGAGGRAAPWRSRAAPR